MPLIVVELDGANEILSVFENLGFRVHRNKWTSDVHHIYEKRWLFPNQIARVFVTEYGVSIHINPKYWKLVGKLKTAFSNADTFIRIEKE